MSKDGFDNEDQIINYLDGKQYMNLNVNMKRFILFLFPNITDNEIITSFKEAGQNKSDLAIECLGIIKHISLKKGSGNSVHQEPVEGFIEHLSEDFGISEELSDYIRLFIWGDGTKNGSGNKEDRVDTRKFKSENPEIINEIKLYFDSIKDRLVERFIILGPKSNIKPDAIYHGTIDKGYWNDSNIILSLICLPENISGGAIPVGSLTFQAWNRGIKGEKSEHKRGVIQLKFPGILNYLID